MLIQTLKTVWVVCKDAQCSPDNSGVGGWEFHGPKSERLLVFYG